MFAEFWLSFDPGFESEYFCYFQVPKGIEICSYNEGIFSDLNWLMFESDGTVEFGWTYVSPKNGEHRYHDFATFLWSLAHMGFEPELPIERTKQRVEFNSFLSKEMAVLRSIKSSIEIDVTRLF